MKNWEDLTAEEKRKHNKKIRNKKLNELINFTIGLITLLIMSVGVDYLGRVILNIHYSGFIGAIMFFGIILWNRKINKDKEKEHNDKIEEEKQNLLKQFDTLYNQLNKLCDDGEIEPEISNQLKNDLHLTELQIIEINRTHISLLSRQADD